VRQTYRKRQNKRNKSIKGKELKHLWKVGAAGGNKLIGHEIVHKVCKAVWGTQKIARRERLLWPF